MKTKRGRVPVLPWRLLAAVLTPVVLAAAGPALAGGYDTPILYSARHMGMGGAAIGYVSDSSALFHNPAGLAQTKFITAMADFSPLLGQITSSPSVEGTEVQSELTLAPFFLVAGGFRVTDWLVLGVGAYPVASAGAEYTYKNSSGVEVSDRTKIAFIEVAPGVAFNLPWNLRLGASYRITILTFDRYQGQLANAGTPMFDMKMKGASFLGFKVGLQWQPYPWLQAGIVYRHKTTTTVKSDSAAVAGANWGETSMDFILPSRLGIGLRGDIPVINLGIALDVEYAFQSQNKSASIHAKSKVDGAPALDILNSYQWNDAVTVRTGLEYGFLGMFKARLGYLFDGKTSNSHFPSAFGTPPAPNHAVTVGGGVSFWKMQVNLAYAYRWGNATVTLDDVTNRDPPVCLACSKSGDYKLVMHGIYLDTSIDF